MEKQIVRQIGNTFIKRGVGFTMAVAMVTLVVAFTTSNEWIVITTVIGSLYTLSMVIVEGLLWIRIASRSVDGLTTFYSAVSGFRMLLTLAVMFGYYLACGREEMLGFFCVFAPFYVILLVHHSIYFGMKSKIIDQLNDENN